LNGEKLSAAKCRFFGNCHVAFWAPAAVASASLGVLFAWPVADASYRYAKHLAAVDIGWETVTPADPVVDQLGITATMLNAANQPDEFFVNFVVHSIARRIRRQSQADEFQVFEATKDTKDTKVFLQEATEATEEMPPFSCHRYLLQKPGLAFAWCSATAG
jgi:hypothetical protein